MAFDRDGATKRLEEAITGAEEGMRFLRRKMKGLMDE